MRKKKLWLVCLCAIFACQTVTNLTVPTYANEPIDDLVQEDRAAVNAYQAIREYWKMELTGDMKGLESDQELISSIKKLDEKAQHYLDTMLDPTTSEHLWNDEAYNSAETGAKVTESLDRLKMITIQIYEPTSSLYQNKQAIAKVKSALRFILDKKYGPTTVKANTNWWDWEIGAPKSMVDVAILIYDELDAKTINDITKTIDRFVPKADYRLNSTLKETGANLCDKVAIVIKRAALDENEERLAHAKKCMSPLFSYSSSGDGYYPDGSFIQHGNIPYNGSYGYVLLDELTNCIIMLSFTDYAIDQEDIAFYEHTLLRHYIPFLSYGGNMVDSVRGRAVSRKASQGDTMGVQTMGVLLQYADVAATPQTKTAIYQQLKGIVDTKFAQPQSEDFSLLLYADYIRVKNLANNNAYAAMIRNSFAVYSYMDRIVSHRKGYTFTLAANSIRMCTEQGNSENLLGRYQGQGYTQIYNDDINQYNEDYNATVDQLRLAGVTTAHQQLGFLTAGQSAYSGGSTLDGINGVAGFILTGDKKLTTLNGGFGSETDTGVKSGITARKSYFVFGDKIVYLGSGINNLGYDANVDYVESIVENRKTFSGMKLSVDGSEVVNANGSDTISNPTYAYLSGKTANTGIGYIFLQDMELNVKKETRNATWSDVNKLAKFTDTTPVSNDFISMGVDHGKNPNNDTYAWVVLPNVSQSALNTYMSDPTIEVLENSLNVHGVKDKESGQIAYNFFTQAESSDHQIAVSDAASLVMEQSDEGYRIAISDPTRSKTSVNVTINGFSNLTHVGITQGDAEVVSTSDNSMTIKVNFDAKDGQPRLVEIGTTFETKTNNLALNKSAYASSVVQNSATLKRLANFAVDGDMTTRWASNYERGNPAITKEEADTGWLVVDLGAEVSFNQVKISWELAVSNDYEIQISNDESTTDFDQKTWATVAYVKENTGYKEKERKDDITFDEVSARYIRMKSNLNSRPTDATAGPAGGLSIYEFEVYNSVDLAKSVARGEQLLQDYPEASAFATPQQFETLKNNLETQIRNAKSFMANGANYTEDALLELATNLNQACKEYDQAVLHVTGIKIEGGDITALDKGESMSLQAVITPLNAYCQDVQWRSSDRNIVRVDENGVITGVNNGQATITVTSKENNLSDSVTVQVVVRPKAITLDQEQVEMKKGEVTKIHATISPTEVANTALQYRTSDANVVTVGDDGTITAVGVGEADIIVTTDLNPDLKAICHVIVKANLVATSDNLALLAGTQATASSSVTATNVSPQGAIDGDFNTRWASNYRAPLSEEEAEAQWWMMELPEAVTFNHIDITWFSETVYGKEYQILVSDDGNDWTVAYHETDGQNKTYGFDFETVTGKFIKFQGIRRSQTGGGYGLVEFEVYYKMDYDEIITKAKTMVNVYPSELASYTQLKKAISDAETLVVENPNFTSDELMAVLTAVQDAMNAYAAHIVPITGIQGFEMSLSAETEALLSYQITPDNATNQAITFVNHNPDIVSIDENYMVHAIKRGTAVVHITTVDGAFETDVIIHVSSDYSPEISASDITITVGSDFDPLAYAKAMDMEDGEIVLTAANVIANTVDTGKEGVGIVTYRVIDSDGNSTEKTITVTVIKDQALEMAKHDLTNALKFAKTLKESNYTAESYRKLLEAINQGDTVLQDEKATVADMKAAYETLQAAIKALKAIDQNANDNTDINTDHQNGGTHDDPSINNTNGDANEINAGANTGTSYAFATLMYLTELSLWAMIALIAYRMRIIDRILKYFSHKA